MADSGGMFNLGDKNDWIALYLEAWPLPQWVMGRIDWDTGAIVNPVNLTGVLEDKWI